MKPESVKEEVLMEDNVEKQLETLLRPASTQVVGAGTAELKKMIEATVILVRSIRRLDKTSSRLAVGNIVVGICLGVLAGIQIYLMVRGH